MLLAHQADASPPPTANLRAGTALKNYQVQDKLNKPF